MQGGGIETGEPHIADNHQAKRVTGILEAFCQSFAARFIANMRLVLGFVAGTAGNHHLDLPCFVAAIMPLRPQRDNLIV